MRFNTARFALAVTLLSGVAFTTTAWAGGWFSDDNKEVTLEELLRNPEKYKDTEVVFTVYFNRIAEEYNPFYTEFHSDMYGNFTAWPIDARLYEKRDFQRCYPHFYVNSQTDAWRDVKKLERFDAIECVGIVKHVFRGRPHIEIMSTDEVSYGLDADEVKAAIRADADYLAGNYERAERGYERALSAKVPGVVRADLHRRLGDARYGAKRYDSARSAYRAALRDAPNSALLKQNVAACTQAYERANGNTAAQIEPTRSIAHYLEPIGDGMTNGVDAVIAALEDPAKVASATMEENVALARRSVHSSNIPEVVAVSNAEPMEESAGEPKEAAADGEAATQEEPVEVVEEPMPEPAEEPMPEEAAPEATEQPAEEAPAEEAPAEPKAEEPAKEVPVEVVEEPKAEEPKTEEPKTEELAVEEPAAEEPAEAPEQVTTEEPKAEEPVVEEPKTEAPAEEVTVEVAEEPMAEETVEEETEPAAEEVMEEAPVAPNAGPEEVAPAAPEESNPRVMKVGDRVTMLPRLPFHGCSGVSYEAFRAVVEEIQGTEDPLEVAGFESEIEISDAEAGEAVVEPVDEPETMDENADETGDVPSEEQGQPEQNDEPVVEPAQPEQPEENPGEEPGQKDPEEPETYDAD